MKVFAFSGSLRTGSYNTKLLHVAAGLLREKGVEVDLWDFKAAKLPVYDPDVHDTDQPASLVDAKARIRAAPGMLVVTPEYNHGLPGGLKNLFDFLSRPPKDSPLRGKVVAHMGATPGGFGTVRAQTQLLALIDNFGMWAVPGEYMLSAADAAFDEQGGLKDEKRRADLSKYLDRFVAGLQTFSK
jgi:chromate reductase